MRRDLFRRGLLALAFALVAALGGIGGVAFANHQFTDVPTTNSFHGDIGWARSHTVAAGYADGTFKPAQALSRGQATRWLRSLNNRFTVQSNTVDLGSSTVFTVAVPCPTGTRPLSGGAERTGNFHTGLFLTDSHPVGNTWEVRWETETASTFINPAALTAFALCGPDNSIG